MFSAIKQLPFNDGKLKQTIQTLMPGFLLCCVVGMAAKFVSEHYGGPTILYALLMGMSLNYLSQEGGCAAGIQFAAKSVLRFGIALLGARITFEQLMALGITPIAIVLVGVPATILFGYLCGRWLKMGKAQSILSGASVGICGASAALAVSAVLPNNKDSERNLIFTIIGVTALSTVAMIAYPLVVTTIGLTESESGIFLGATIHDVAQVVGAGYMMSDDIGDVATFTKLLRVAALVPVVVIISLLAAKYSDGASSKSSKLPLPGFLIAFVIIVTINSTVALPELVTTSMTEASRWCLIIAMVGLGMKASFKELSTMGWKPIFLLVAETLFLAALVAIWLLMAR
ncbi:MAG: putative sulfate exporter family transporter [Motiliproteus sp.]|nr:putative sulfate exporter family transporter [Motiliproteus sp.]MCW9054205.1 putative sulfate exporter family transporter [Motiliproteus sp.]